MTNNKDMIKIPEDEINNAYQNWLDVRHLYGDHTSKEEGCFRAGVQWAFNKLKKQEAIS